MVNLEELTLEDKIMHYLVGLGITVKHNVVGANRTDFDEAVRGLGGKGYVTYKECKHERFKGEIEQVKATQKG